MRHQSARGIDIVVSNGNDLFSLRRDSAGETREKVQQLIREAIEFHIDGLREQGKTVPEPHSFSELIEIGV